MSNYGLGIFLGLMGGMANFFGQILQKKAINEIPLEQRNKTLMKILIRNRTWIVGLIFIIIIGSVFLMSAQSMIGGALMPGLLASGLIVLAIGSSKILKEQLKTSEIIAIILLIIGISLIGFSELAIEGSMTYFLDINFNFRLFLISILFTVAWFGFYFIGKTIKKSKSLFLALGTGFPFVVQNIWVQPLFISMVFIFNGTAGLIEWMVFLIGLMIMMITTILGLIHVQYALSSGNASLIVPIQQIPQQTAPILIFYFIYQFPSPKSYSLLLILVGIALICIAGFFLARRQASLEKIKA